MHKLVKGQSIIFDDPSTLPEQFDPRAFVCHNPECQKQIKVFTTRALVAQFIPSKGKPALHATKICPDCKLEHKLRLRTYVHQNDNKTTDILGFDIVSLAEFMGKSTTDYLEAPLQSA